MSTNSKNVIKPDFLENFTNNVENRFIVVENSHYIQDYQALIVSANNKANQIIQEINVKTLERQIPYISLTVQTVNNLSQQARIIIHDSENTTHFEEKISMQSQQIGTEFSHLVDMLIAFGYKDIRISPLGCDAEIVVTPSFLECAIVDILLDIAMFNSYSFLCKLSPNDKHLFTFKKYDYYKKKALGCFYSYIVPIDKALYYSFAFSARISENSFNIDQYMFLWQQFIQAEYSICRHHEKPISQQIKDHVDIGELPKTLHRRFKDKPSGAYLILRTNKDRTDTLHPFILSLFGLKKYEKGKIKIVSLNDFTKYKSLMENLDVSAFKVVKSALSSSK